MCHILNPALHKVDTNAEKLHSPHSEPETEWSSKLRKERRDRELGDVRFCHLNLLLYWKAERWDISFEAVDQMWGHLFIIVLKDDFIDLQKTVIPL